MIQIDRRPLYRAGGPISRFKLICKRPQAVRLRLTCRTLWDTRERGLAVRIRGHDVGWVAVSTTWTTVDFNIPPERLSSGFNVVEVHWPVQQWDLPAWKTRVASELLAGEIVGLCPVYGEIHSFVAAVERIPL